MARIAYADETGDPEITTPAARHRELLIFRIAVINSAEYERCR